MGALRYRNATDPRKAYRNKRYKPAQPDVNRPPLQPEVVNDTGGNFIKLLSCIVNDNSLDQELSASQPHPLLGFLTAYGDLDSL